MTDVPHVAKARKGKGAPTKAKRRQQYLKAHPPVERKPRKPAPVLDPFLIRPRP